MTITVILIIFIVILTFLSGYFSGGETALFSLSPSRIKSYQHSKDPRNQLTAKLLMQPRDLLVTVFMLNTLVNILLQNTSSSLFGEAAGWDLKVGVPLFITLILGEIIPKNLCMQNNVWVAYRVIPSINFFHNLVGPLRRFTVRITGPISRILFFYLKKEESISKEELQHVLSHSEKQGVLTPYETNLVKGYLNLQNAIVKEVMCPKEDIIYYEISEPLTRLIHLFVDQECTRIPVCEDNIDHVLGYIDAKEFFINQEKITDQEKLKKYLEKPLFVPETTPVQNLLHQFDQADKVFALAVDEYGSIEGVITREDIMEVVIGKISDRRDQKSLYTVAGEDEIIASGKMELTEFNEIFNIELHSQEGMVTIGGWLTEHLGDLPKVGAKYEWKNILFQVLAADQTRIRRLYIRKINHKRAS